MLWLGNCVDSCFFPLVSQLQVTPRVFIALGHFRLNDKLSQKCRFGLFFLHESARTFSKFNVYIDERKLMCQSEAWYGSGEVTA